MKKIPEKDLQKSMNIFCMFVIVLILTILELSQYA